LERKFTKIPANNRHVEKVDTLPEVFLSTRGTATDVSRWIKAGVARKIG
jgi:hypothetical protein